MSEFLRAPAHDAGAAPVLRRTCACGARTSAPGGSCAECERKKLQPKLAIGGAQDAEEFEADRIADAVMSDRGVAATSGGLAAQVRRAPVQSGAGAGAAAPPVVDHVLAGPGEALDSGARHFMERRFGRDFSNVRVHVDAQAAASARAVDAHAYTVGDHVVFGTGRYAPSTVDGRRLLAHELTHVLQQGGALRRASLSPDIGGSLKSEDEEQPVQRLQRQSATHDDDTRTQPLGASQGQAQPTDERQKKLEECKKAAAPDPELCDPKTPPGWADFSGAAQESSRWGAETYSSIKRVDVPSQKCEESITGKASGAVKRFQGVFDGTKSWVKTKSVNAADPAKNGAAPNVAKCESDFGKLKKNQTGTWSLNTTPSTECPASPTPRGDTATSKAECATVIAKDYTDWAIAESQRLLKHEQTHLALTCAMAKKGNDLLAGGTAYAKVDGAIDGKLATAQHDYDTQSEHGCKAAEQASWESEIAKGLPAIKIV